MSQILEIMVNGTPLDLLPKEETRFYLTKQVHDWIDLQTRNSDFTKTITIPTTNLNRQLIGLELPDTLRHTNFPSNFLPCEVLINGIPMIQDAQLLVTTQNVIEETCSITIFGGATKFFSQLSSDPISALGWSEFDIIWNLANVASMGNRTTGYTYANNTWFSNVSLRLAEANGLSNDKQLAYGIGQPELDISGVWLWVHTIMDKIFGQLVGLTVDTSKMDVVYNALAIPVPNFSSWEKWQNPPGFYSQVAQDTGVTYQQSQVIDPLPFPVEVADDPGNWDVGLNKWVIVTPAGSYALNLTMVGTVAGFTTSTTYNETAISIINETTGASLGRARIQDIANNPTPAPFSVEINTSATLNPGDVIRAVLSLGQSIEGTIKIWLDQPQHGINFSLRSVGSQSQDFFEMNESLPVISQVDFVRNIFALLNIVVTEDTDIVTMHYMGEILENKVFENNVAVNKPIQLDSVIAGYGSNNIVQYVPNDRIERLDQNSSFPMEAENLPKEVIKIESIFSALDDQEAIGQQNSNNVSVPIFDIEYQEITDNKMTLTNGTIGYSTQERNNLKAGDYVIVDPVGLALRRKIIQILTDFSGEFDEVAPGQINDGNWNHWSFAKNDNGAIYIAQIGAPLGFLNIHDGAFVDTSEMNYPIFYANQWGGRTLDIRWSTLLTEYFTVITDAMRRPFGVQGWFHITAVEFYILDGMQLVYIPYFGAHFYVNKFEQWKFNDFVRLQLIKVEK